jgi:hypothetical protein
MSERIDLGVLRERTRLGAGFDYGQPLTREDAFALIDTAEAAQAFLAYATDLEDWELDELDSLRDSLARFAP